MVWNALLRCPHQEHLMVFCQCLWFICSQTVVWVASDWLIAPTWLAHGEHWWWYGMLNKHFPHYINFFVSSLLVKQCGSLCIYMNSQFFLSDVVAIVFICSKAMLGPVVLKCFSFLHWSNMFFHAFSTGSFIDAWALVRGLLWLCPVYGVDFSVHVEYIVHMLCFLRILPIFSVVPLIYGRIIFSVDTSSSSSTFAVGCF